MSAVLARWYGFDGDFFEDADESVNDGFVDGSDGATGDAFNSEIGFVNF